jgi:flagellar hook-associated protein 1
MSSGIMGIGVSGLQAYQRGLSVTGHNISNAATEGYSRQRMELTARNPQLGVNGYFGTGVQVSAVNRVFDQFVENQLRSATSSSQQSSVLYDYSRRVDSLLANPDSGLAPALQRFFAAVQEVSNDPTSNAARQLLVSEGESLADRFRFIDERLEEQRGLVNGQIGATVTEINSLAQALADVNQSIVATVGRGGPVPNDLLDQRDTLVRELAERVNVSVNEQDDGALNIFIGNGQSLVLGTRASSLTTGAFGEDPRQVSVGFQSGSSTVDISRFMTGGRLGALLEVRSSVLDTAQDSLGLTAVGLARTFNEQHMLGQDLNGALGGEFFREPRVQVLGSGTGALPAVEVVDVGNLTAGEYRLRYQGGAWELRSLPEGTLVPDFADVGLGISTAGLDQGETFLIRPTRTAARQVATEIRNPAEVAAASPLTAAAAAANGGNAVVRSVQAVDRDSLVVPPAGTPAIVAFDGSGYTIDGAPATTRESAAGTVIQGSGWELTLKGTPVPGDRFEVALNAGGVGDNRNALALAGLQAERVLAGGTASLEGSYNTLISEVGTRTRQSQIASEAQGRLLQEARAQRESVSGVNLDEEAANLLRYQQAYQAAAQVIAVTNTLFDTLLGAVRR